MNIDQIPSPCFVLDERLLRSNLQQLHQIARQAGVRIILAFKGFSMWGAFPVVREYLEGATASSLYEAQLCMEEMGCQAHTYAPAYLPEEFEQILQLSSHLTFNSLSEYERYRPAVLRHRQAISCGLRVNPEYSTVRTPLYDPCAPGSRLGILAEQLDELPQGIEGLHFHNLCESDSNQLEKTLAAFERRFGHLLPQLKWVNLGGGHLITARGYDTNHLIRLLRDFRTRHEVELILEPGSAIAWQAGILLAKVLDIVQNKSIRTAILDVSFTAHMPDTLEMPYRPLVRGAGNPGPESFNYRLGGVSCLAGDFMEEYGFAKPLEVGQKLIFEDMMHYTMVKTTMFNGVKHPDIAIWTEAGQLKMLRQFEYSDFKRRLC